MLGYAYTSGEGMTGGGGMGEKDGAGGGATPALPRSSVSGRALSGGPPTGQGRHARARGANQRRRWVERMHERLHDARHRHVLALVSTGSPPERGSGEAKARRIWGCYTTSQRDDGEWVSRGFLLF
jgi:hypothetical protein